MKNAPHNRIRRLLSVVTLAGLAFSASTVSAGVNVWTTKGPEGEDIRTLAIDPANPSTLYAGTSGGGVRKGAREGCALKDCKPKIVRIAKRKEDRQWKQ